MEYDERKYQELEKKVFTLLQTNFNSFFKHAIDHFTSEDNEFNRTMYIFSIQTALEVLVKLYVLNEYGVLVLLDFEQSHEINYKPKSELDLLSMLDKMKLKTREFNELKKIILNDVKFYNSDKELISEFQKLRNQVAHMGINSIDNAFIYKTNLFVTRVFNKLDFKDRISKNYDLENTLEKILGKNLFKEYLDKTSIINETEKYVVETYDKNDICYCLECGHKTAIYDASLENIKCYLCGYKINTYYVNVLDCPDCNCKSFYFDVLNTTSINNPDGHCSCCGAHYSVSKCDICGDFYIPNLVKCLRN